MHDFHLPKCGKKFEAFLRCKTQKASTVAENGAKESQSLVLDNPWVTDAFFPPSVPGS